ncbi:MAG TPA: hypothetical protein VES62_07460 [Thermoleophilaceae bacterium]|nr:hypothetical protein [Thermoleophilaceae bacterium]
MKGIGSSEQRAVVQLTLREGIQARAIHDALDRLFELHGCSVCGLVGIDLDFRVLPPERIERLGLLKLGNELQRFEGVEAVSVIGG